MAPPFCKLARQKGSQGHPRRPKDNVLHIMHGFGFRILDTSRSFFNDSVKVSVSIFALISQVAKNGQEPAKNHANNELLKTWSSKLQFAECRQPPANAYLETALAQNGGRRCHATWRIQ
jgi:hypothetical protein